MQLTRCSIESQTGRKEKEHMPANAGDSKLVLFPEALEFRLATTIIAVAGEWPVIFASKGSRRRFSSPMGTMQSRRIGATFVPGLRLVAVSVLALGALAGGARAQLPLPAKTLPTLTQAAQIRRLSPEQASLGYPVLVRGVITMDAPAPNFIVQDATAGIYVEEASPRGSPTCSASSSKLKE